MVAISSWGRLSKDHHHTQALSHQHPIQAQLKNTRAGLAYGMGRSYGDVCLNPDGVLWKTTSLDRLIHFNENTGRLVCEAGVLLRDIQRLFVPRGWTLPVTPGTLWVTVGGAIANDVHGKNHHIAGSFGNHVQRITLMRTDGSSIECGPTRLPEWFSATVGGIGLTGVITEADIQLQKTPGPYLQTETIAFTQLREFFELAHHSEALWEHTVSWIDCRSKQNGRGIFMRANPSNVPNRAVLRQKNRTIPPLFPISVMNRLTLAPCNALYYHLKKRQEGHRLMHCESFLYPLDHVSHWNRMYGPRGFFQYQSVVPLAAGHDAIEDMLNQIKRAGVGSCLAVLKTFGAQASQGMLSFPQPGVTLALDFPNNGKKTHNLFQRLDTIVTEAHGRIYLAKDARMPKALFESGYPRLSEFLHYRDAGISSALSRRLMGN